MKYKLIKNFVNVIGKCCIGKQSSYAMTPDDDRIRIYIVKFTSANCALLNQITMQQWSRDPERT
jgi:hypothetical protein